MFVWISPHYFCDYNLLVKSYDLKLLLYYGELIDKEKHSGQKKIIFANVKNSLKIIG